MHEYQLDLREYHCPLPVLITQKMLASLGDNVSLTIWLNKTSSEADFSLLCEQHSYRLEVVERNAQATILRIKK